MTTPSANFIIPSVSMYIWAEFSD